MLPTYFRDIGAKERAYALSPTALPDQLLCLVDEFAQTRRFTTVVYDARSEQYSSQHVLVLYRPDMQVAISVSENRTHLETTHDSHFARGVREIELTYVIPQRRWRFLGREFWGRQVSCGRILFWSDPQWGRGISTIKKRSCSADEVSYLWNSGFTTQLNFDMRAGVDTDVSNADYALLCNAFRDPGAFYPDPKVMRLTAAKLAQHERGVVYNL